MAARGKENILQRSQLRLRGEFGHVCVSARLAEIMAVQSGPFKCHFCALMWLRGSYFEEILT